MRPPGGENLMALLSRFQITCCSRDASARMARYGGVARTSICGPPSPSAGRIALTEATISSTGSIITNVSGSLPRFRRDMSSRSEIMRACVAPLRSMAARPRIVSVLPPRWRSTWVQLMMALSGVRSSCDSTAMKSSFMRLTCSASLRALRSRSSSCWRWRSSATRCDTSVATAIVTPGSMCGDTLHST